MSGLVRFPVASSSTGLTLGRGCDPFSASRVSVDRCRRILAASADDRWRLTGAQPHHRPERRREIAHRLGQVVVDDLDGLVNLRRSLGRL
jgi:hypothetical protein